MLRLLVVLLLAANALVWAWGAGHLQAWTGPLREGEPARLARQLRPESIQVLPAGAPVGRPPVALERGESAPPTGVSPTPAVSPSDSAATAAQDLSPR